MLNPIHLIVTSPDMAGFLRDFKRFTTAKFKANLEATEPSDLKLFIDAQGSYRFWMETNAFCSSIVKSLGTGLQTSPRLGYQQKISTTHPAQ